MSRRKSWIAAAVCACISAALLVSATYGLSTGNEETKHALMLIAELEALERDVQALTLDADKDTLERTRENLRSLLTPELSYQVMLALVSADKSLLRACKDSEEQYLRDAQAYIQKALEGVQEQYPQRLPELRGIQTAISRPTERLVPVRRQINLLVDLNFIPSSLAANLRLVDHLVVQASLSSDESKLYEARRCTSNAVTEAWRSMYLVKERSKGLYTRSALLGVIGMLLAAMAAGSTALSRAAEPPDDARMGYAEYALIIEIFDEMRRLRSGTIPAGISQCESMNSDLQTLIKYTEMLQRNDPASLQYADENILPVIMEELPADADELGGIFGSVNEQLHMLEMKIRIIQDKHKK